MALDMETSRTASGPRKGKPKEAACISDRSAEEKPGVAVRAPGGPDSTVAVADLSGVAELRRALAVAGVAQAWLVGGSLRDLLYVGPSRSVRGPPDLDVTLSGDGAAAAARVATDLGGAAFALDEAQGAWRVALRAGGTVDLIPLRAPTIAEDLAGRDFTVNALAYDLIGAAGWLDPLDGRTDLAAGVLRPCAPEALREDPVRVLRAYRFAATLGFVFAPGLAGLVAAAAPGLSRVAAERVRTEFFAVLGLRAAAGALRAMLRDGVLPVLFPFLPGWKGFDQGDYHAHDLLEHALRTAEAAVGLANEPGGLPQFEKLSAHLDQEWEPGVTRRALLICCALLHDVAKPETARTDGNRRRFLGHDVRGGHAVRRLLTDLRVGRRAATAAQRVVGAHLRLFQLAHQDPPTPRARLRYLRDLRSEVPEAVVLSLADELATGPEPPALASVRRTAEDVLELYWRRRDARPVRPLLRGRDLVRELGLEPGPRIGELLREVEEAERTGTVATRADALALVRRRAAEMPRPES
jgi:poly(A) polymerase/tRNA nucleotidyltransferase (CCA-adding enzyme)